LPRNARTNHGIAGYQFDKLLFTPSLCSGGSFRQHQVAQLGAAVPYPNFLSVLMFRPNSARTLRGSMTMRDR
jgi:hypothetical protein